MYLGKNLEFLKLCMYLVGLCFLGMGEKKLFGNEKYLCLLVKKNLLVY